MDYIIVPIIWIVLIVLLIAFIASNIVIVPQAKAYVIERLGTYRDTWSTGLHFKVPLFERIARKVTLKEQVVDFPPQPVITKDNVTMQIDTVVFFYITDPKLYAYGVERPLLAIENLTATTLRNIIGDLELDETLTSRETINAKMQESLDIATDPWGIKVTRVELKNIIPPAAIQEAMEKQMKAERERRESILRAEGEKKSMVLVAEGHKESAVLNAEKQLFLPPRQRRRRRLERRKAKQRPSVPYRRLRRTVSALSRRPGLTMQFSSLRVWKHSRQLPTERLIRLSFLRISRELQAW